MDVLTAQPFCTVVPKPAFCVKLRRTAENGREEKIFFNFCVCIELPPPVEDIDEDQLATILESPDPGKFRIPISVGDPHSEQDNKGEQCSAYDIVLNESFYSKRVESNELFRAFLILVAIDAVESKYDLRNIDRQNWIILKNRKSVGELQVQRIKKLPRPLIVELEEAGTSEVTLEKPVKLESRNPRSIEPKYEIRKDKAENPTKITAVFFQLDGVRLEDVDLQVGLHRVNVKATSKNYESDVFVPFSLNEKLVEARLIADEGKLIVEVPLLI